MKTIAELQAFLNKHPNVGMSLRATTDGTAGREYSVRLRRKGNNEDGVTATHANLTTALEVAVACYNVMVGVA